MLQSVYSNQSCKYSDLSDVLCHTWHLFTCVRPGRRILTCVSEVSTLTPKELNWQREPALFYWGSHYLWMCVTKRSVHLQQASLELNLSVSLSVSLSLCLCLSLSLSLSCSGCWNFSSRSMTWRATVGSWEVSFRYENTPAPITCPSSCGWSHQMFTLPVTFCCSSCVQAGPGESKSDAEGRIWRLADHLLRPGGETEKDHGGQPGACVSLDGGESSGGQQAERREREGQQVDWTPAGGEVVWFSDLPLTSLSVL